MHVSTHIEEHIIREAQAFFAHARPTHDWAHVLRVHALATHIGAVEGADEMVVSYAAYLHDVGRCQEEADPSLCHAVCGAQIARDILRRCGLMPSCIEAVVHCVETHRFRGGLVPRTLEARVLYDADKLDAIGAIGVARAYAYAGEHNQRLVTPFEPDSYGGLGINHAEHSPVKEYYVKLSKLKDRMLTSEGRRMAMERDAFMQAFFHRLEMESRGEL